MKSKLLVALFFFLAFSGSPCICRSKRAILSDVDWLPEEPRNQDMPASSRVMEQKQPSFFHLDDGGVSETLEVELDNARSRRMGLSSASKTKRETMMPPEAEAVHKQFDCQESQDDILPMLEELQKQLAPSRVMKETRTKEESLSKIPKKRKLRSHE